MPAFIDINVLVYCTAADAPAKRSQARVPVERLSGAGEAVVRTQVLIELFHIRDAMVVQGALQAQAHTLYREDLRHGQRFGALAVVNPFID